jgi:hypothetical protein
MHSNLAAQSLGRQHVVLEFLEVVVIRRGPSLDILENEGFGVEQGVNGMLASLSQSHALLDDT